MLRISHVTAVPDLSQEQCTLPLQIPFTMGHHHIAELDRWIDAGTYITGRSIQYIDLNKEKAQLHDASHSQE